LATAKNLFSDGDQICLPISLYGMKAVTQNRKEEAMKTKSNVKAGTKMVNGG